MASYTPDRYLASSISSLSSSRHQSSQIAKAYRQAAQLFLTRRLPEAYSTIEPVITRPPPSQHKQPNGDGSSAEDEPEPAPIANASRTTRVKVWSFYLTFLNSVVELGPEEGKHAFGAAKWRSLVQKCRDGNVWEEVVQIGYGGAEGGVDAEVVVNLTTLLLTHAPNQYLNQQRLETYLSATSHPSFDLPDSRFTSPRAVLARRNSNNPNNGTSTPRDLHTRLKLLELYTLHILPRNNAWDYSREFIMMSEVLDDDRKEAFLQALHGLREEMQAQNLKEEELRKSQEAALAQKLEEERKAREEAERREEEEERRRRLKKEEEKPPATPRSSGRPAAPADHRRTGSISQHPHTRSSPNKKSLAKPSSRSFNSMLYSVLDHLQQLVLGTAQSIRTNPIAMLRALMFLVVFVMTVGREDVRVRLRQMLARAWAKVRGTIGMGVKVSYI